MSNKILTISVAAYNVERYLDDTLDSLVVPELLDDIEVIVVDDGTKDNSYNIAKKYEEIYPATFKAIHKSNGGYGSTVNYSVVHATGKYFKLLDGDDFYDKDGLKKLVNILKTIDADIVFTQYNYYVNGTTKLAICYDDKQVNKLLSIEDFNFNAGTPMHALTYRTQLLKDSGIKLKEHILYTDNAYVAEPAKNAKTIFFLNTPVYNYRLGVEGQSVGRIGIIKHIDESEEIAVDLTRFYRDSVCADLQSKKYILVNVASTCVNYVVGILKMDMGYSSLKRLISFDKEIKDISEEIYRKMADIDRKASMSLRFIRKSGYLLYWLFSFMYRFID